MRVFWQVGSRKEDRYDHKMIPIHFDKITWRRVEKKTAVLLFHEGEGHKTSNYYRQKLSTENWRHPVNTGDTHTVQTSTPVCVRDPFSIKGERTSDAMRLKELYTDSSDYRFIRIVLTYSHIVPRCRKRAWGRPCKVPARATEGWCRGRWWWQHGSLQAEKTPWSQTSHTASAVLHLASLRPRTRHCPPRTDISLMASEGTHREKEWIYMDIKHLQIHLKETFVNLYSKQTNSSLMASVGGTICFCWTFNTYNNRWLVQSVHYQHKTAHM